MIREIKYSLNLDLDFRSRELQGKSAAVLCSDSSEVDWYVLCSSVLELRAFVLSFHKSTVL